MFNRKENLIYNKDLLLWRGKTNSGTWPCPTQLGKINCRLERNLKQGNQWVFQSEEKKERKMAEQEEMVRDYLQERSLQEPSWV